MTIKGRIGAVDGFHDPCDVTVDHQGKFIVIQFDTDELSFSPAEAKSLAAALVHYAELAQKVRDREDERVGNQA